MREIPLTKGQVAFVDDADYERVAEHKWQAVWCKFRRAYFAERQFSFRPRIRTKMHRFIMECSPGDGVQIDHINGNPLDNRRSNLRPVNHSQNQMNRRLDSSSLGGFPGVSFCLQTGRWKARLVLNGREMWLGRFADKESAIAAVVAAREEHFGEYARRT